MKAIFKEMVIATAGPLPDQLTDQNCAKWTELRSGRFTKDFDKSVTHILCTDEQYQSRKKNTRLKEAMRRKRTHIVHMDWFEYSCIQNKKLPEKLYNFKKLRIREKEAKEQARKEVQVEKNRILGDRWIRPDLYKIFVDKYFFEYQVDLVKSTKDEFGTYHTKHVLHLFRSIADPPLYWFGVRVFKKTNDGKWQHRGYHRQFSSPGLFRDVIKQFQLYFYEKTGIPWKHRILKAGTRDDKFQYTPPTGGKPVGGILTKGLTAEECFELNFELRMMHYALFDDELPELPKPSPEVSLLWDELFENEIPEDLEEDKENGDKGEDGDKEEDEEDGEDGEYEEGENEDE